MGSPERTDTQEQAMAALCDQIEGSARPGDQLTAEEWAYYDRQRAADAHYLDDYDRAEVARVVGQVEADAILIARGAPIDELVPDDGACGRCGGVVRYAGAPCGDCDRERT